MSDRFWSTYWYNGAVFGSEIARGFDVFDLKPTKDLSENEIAAAREARVDRLNVQRQDRLEWDPSFAVVRSFLDQANRARPRLLDRLLLRTVGRLVDNAERHWDRSRFAARIQLKVAAGLLGGRQKYADLRQALRDLADS